MNKQLAVLILFLGFFSLDAQVKFEQGWFADNEGNKTECYIRNTEKFCPASQKTYRLSEDSAEKVALLEDVSSLYVDGTLYERRTFTYDMPDLNENYFMSTSAEPGPTYLVHKVYLADGNTSSLRENNNFRQQIFIALGPSGFKQNDVENLSHSTSRAQFRSRSSNSVKQHL